MPYTFDIDSVVQNVKNLVDCHRCTFCDNLEGGRWRYACGHISCDECVATSSSCLLCLTPLGELSLKPVQDAAFTKRTEHAKQLLSACQDALGLDVYMRHRVSEQQKIEKELFPECIQAPVKYSNKRKSLNTFKNKYNRSVTLLPGEKISPVKKMDKSVDYVQNWLNQIDEEVPKKRARKPLSILNVNCTPEKSYLRKGTSVKNTPIKTTHSKITPIKRRADLFIDKFKESETRLLQRKWFHKDRDESGIVMDDSTCIYIEDSQDIEKAKDTSKVDVNTMQSIISLAKTDGEKKDKDTLAWLAVLEAEENASKSAASQKCDNNQYSNSIKENADMSNKVPFYKKSHLIEPCKNCSNIGTDKTTKKTAGQSKDVQITIESNSFITTIKITSVETKTPSKKQSSSVQTDISDISPEAKVPQLELTDKEMRTIEKDSLDLFTAELADKVPEEKPKPMFVDEAMIQKQDCDPVGHKTVISDSDSDDGINKSETLVVTAEVHRSSDQFDYGVFSELETSDMISRTRKLKKRGRTPNSSDSSDKENRDPNRAKRIKSSKKLPLKKKSTKKLGMVN